MPDDIVSKAQQWLTEHEDDLINDLRDLLRIPSLETEAESGAPFGPENRRALDFMLDKSKEHGFDTTNMDGYCGYADMGSGDGLVMVLGHLDVVPVSDDWKHEPFGAEIDGEYIYARGAIDDKGPTVAAYYAARALKETWPELASRIRIVYGCNEESGFKCIEHYMETEEPPNFGVAPDAGWPLIQGEKGISDFIIEAPLMQGEVELISLKGGSRPNIVIDLAEARARVADSARAHVEEKLADVWDKNVSAVWEGSDLVISATGKAAHGSTPFMGDNAVTKIMRLLFEVSPVSCQEVYNELLWFGDHAGLGLGVPTADVESGLLTSNLGIVETIDGRLKLTINVRYPVTAKSSELKRRCEERMASLQGGFELVDMSDSPPLYFPMNHPIVGAIRAAHAEEMGSDPDPHVMGGGTYARAVPNSVAIGTGWAGDGPAHENDERVKIEHLHKMARIYANILVRLCVLAEKN